MRDRGMGRDTLVQCLPDLGPAGWVQCFVFFVVSTHIWRNDNGSVELLYPNEIFARCGILVGHMDESGPQHSIILGQSEIYSSATERDLTTCIADTIWPTYDGRLDRAVRSSQRSDTYHATLLSSACASLSPFNGFNVNSLWSYGWQKSQDGSQVNTHATWSFLGHAHDWMRLTCQFLRVMRPSWGIMTWDSFMSRVHTQARYQSAPFLSFLSSLFLEVGESW